MRLDEQNQHAVRLMGSMVDMFIILERGVAEMTTLPPEERVDLENAMRKMASGMSAVQSALYRAHPARQSSADLSKVYG